MNNLYIAINNYLKSRVKNIEDANDLTQDVWYKAMKSTQEYDEIGHFKSWIFSIAKNALIDYYRKNSIAFEEFKLEPYHTDVENPDNLQEALEDCLKTYINQLDQGTKFLMKKSELDGQSQKALAEELEIPYSTIRSKIQRGRNQIKKMFEKDCHLQLSPGGQVIDCYNKNQKSSCN